jgi:hypothetical protein
MEFEFTRMGILFFHLIACCVAIGVVLTSDVDMIKRLIKADPDDRLNASHLSNLQKTVLRALIALWITGAAIIALDASIKGWAYFANPKLQSKLAVVILLTMNGFVLHKYVLPLVQKAGSLLRLSFSHRMLAIFTGSVSGVSWFYAAMLGIGRPLNWKYSLGEILAAYPVLIAGGFVSMLVLTALAQQKTDGAIKTFKSTGMAGAS